MKITPTRPRRVRGNGTNTAGSLSWMHKAEMHPWQREDYSEAVKAVKDLRQNDEQESIYPSLSSHHISSKTISRKAMQMEHLVHTIFVLVFVDSVASQVDLSKVGGLPVCFLQGVSLAGNGASLVGDGRCKQYTAPPTYNTRKYFLACCSIARVASFLCAISEQSSSRPRAMLRTLLDPAPFSLQHHTPTSDSLLDPSNRTSPSTRGEGPCQECERMEHWRAKKKGHQEGMPKASERVWGGRCHGARRVMEHRKKCWKTEEPCPENMETCSLNAKPWTKKTFSSVGCGMMWKVKWRKGKGQTKKPDKRKVKVGKERWREKGQGLRLAVKWYVWFGWTGQFSRSFARILRWRVLGMSVVFRCVPVVFPFVLDVTVLSSNVRVVGEVGFLWFGLWNGWAADLFSSENAKQVWLWEVRRKRRLI